MKKLFFLLFAFLLFIRLQCPDTEREPRDFFSRLSYDFAIQNGKLYLTNTVNIRSFDLTDPLSPVLSGTASTEEELKRLQVVPGFYIIGDDFSSIVGALDANGVPLQGEHTPLFQGCLPVAANATHFFALENMANGCRHPSFMQPTSVRMIPVSNPLPDVNSDLIKTVPLDDPRDVVVENNLLFIADGTNGLKVFSVADSEHITLLTHRSDIIAHGVHVAENRLTVTGNDRIFVFDYSQPANLQLLAEMPF